MHKHLALGIFALLAVMLVATVAMPTFNDVEAKKAKSCNNVKVRVAIDNVVNGTVLVTTATIGEKSVVKTQTVELEGNETGIVAPLNFKKVACPAIGSDIFGNVNGTGFAGAVKSLKKPNVIEVTLP